MSERYEIREKLGKGGMGAVYLAYDTVLKREVALKRLLPLEETNLNDAADDALEREAAALARFQHPNIVTIFAFEEDEDGPYVAMEKIEGEDLKVTIQKGALAVDDFIELTEQCLDPLVAAGELNLLHRDIKPANIMLNWLSTGKFQVKILDFGLAKFSEKPQQQTLDQKGFFLGSIDFLTPEQLLCKALDQRTDLYSLGCVLYFCLAQEAPFHGENPADTTRRHMDHKCDPISEIRPDLPKPLADWLMRMISRDRNDRPADAREALKEFQAAKAGISPVVEESKSGTRSVVISDKDGDSAPVASPPSQPVAIVESDEDIPVAKIVETGPRMVLVGDKMQATGPHRKIQATGPHRRTSHTRSLPVQPVAKKTLPLPFILIGAGVLGLIGMIIAFTGGNGDSKNGEKGTNKSVGSVAKAQPKGKGKATPPVAKYKPRWKPLSTSDFVSPVQKDLPTPKPIPGAKVPVTAGLIGHFRADAGAFSPDLKSPAKVNDRVSGWANLAPGAKPMADLFLHPEDYEQVGVPKLVEEEGRRYLDFEASSMLRLHQWQSLQHLKKTNALTAVVVMKRTGQGNHFLRIDGHQRGGFFHMRQDPNHLIGYSGGTLQGNKLIRVALPSNQFFITSYVVDGPGKTHKIRAVNKMRMVKESKAEPLTFVPVEVRHLNVGIYYNPKSGTKVPGFFVGRIGEILIFNRALPKPELEKIENYLGSRYFN